MGVLNKVSFYCAGPMQFAGDGQSWRDLIEKELCPRGIKIYNPYKKPFLDSRYLEGQVDQTRMRQWTEENRLDLISDKMKLVRSSDLCLCDKSDAGIFYLNPKIFTVGTIEELATMNRAKRPCFVLWDDDKPCYWLLGMLKTHYIYRNWKSLLKTITDIDDGIKQPDSTRWKLLREEFR